jgi:NAD(P)H-hydrate epimerase
MILGYTADQVRAAEAPYLEAGVPLMERAAAGLARVIRELSPVRVLILAGPGNNGGDALYAGAALARELDVAIVRSSKRIHEEALAAALEAGAHVERANSFTDLAAHADVIVDGLLGIGTVPPLRGTALEFVEAILPILERPKHPLVVAVDIPSGINPDDGSAPGPVLPADVTVTFGGYKAGLLIEPGSRLAGRIELIDVGIGEALARLEPVVRR